MANFIEQAILKLVDQTSAPANKINVALDRLWKTANKLDSKRIDIKVRATGLAGVYSQVQALHALNTRPQTIRVDSSQLRAATTQAQALRAALANMPAPRIRPTPMAPLGGGGMGSSPGNVFWGRRDDNNAQAAGRIMARAFTAAIGYEIYGAVRRISGEAGRAILNEDSALGALRQSGLSQGQVAMREMMARDVSGAFPELSRANILNSTRELANLAQSAGDARSQMMNFGKAAVNLGTALGDMNKGAESARQLFRTGGLLGVSQDPIRMAEFVDEMQRAIIASGGDVQGGEVRRMVQQMRGQGLDLSPQAIGDLISIRDEGGMGSTAEARMFMNDLTRSNLNRRDLARQQAAGLRDAQGNTIERGELLANPIENVFNRIIPKLEKMGVDLDDAAAVQKALTGRGGLGLTTPGAAFAQRTISQREQIMADRMARARVSLTSAMEDPTLRQNAARIQAQFDNAAAEVTKSLKPAMTGAMEIVAGNLATVANPNASLAARTAAGATSLAALTPVALGAMLTNLPQLLASPQTAPLATAGLALTGSAASLTGAAGALTAAAAASSGLGMGALLARAGVGAAIAAMIVGPIAYTEAGGTLSSDAEKLRRQALEKANNPFGTTREKEKAVQDVMAEQRARGEAIDAVKAEAEARRRIVDAANKQVAAIDAAAAAAQAQAQKPAANENKPLSKAQQKLSEVNTAAGDIGTINAQLRALDQAEKTFAKRRKEIAKMNDPLARQAAEEALDESVADLPKAREAARKRLAEADRKLVELYKGVELGPESKKDPEHIKRLREARKKMNEEILLAPKNPDQVTAKGRGEEADVPGFRAAVDALPPVAAQLEATFSGLPAKGAEMAQGFVGGVNAQGIGAAIGDAFLAVASTAQVNVTVNQSSQPNVGTTRTTE